MRFRLVHLLVPSVLILGACRDAEVAAYRVPKEQPDPLPPVLTGELPMKASANDMANTAVPTATGSDLTWTAPGEWKQKAVSAMRKGSYAIVGSDGAEADLSITAFPGNVGGDLANINRWRGQISLPPINEADLSSQTQHIDANGLHMTFVDFANTTGDKPQRVMGAIVPFGSATWFFKLSGPDVLVASQRETFLAFLQTIKPPVEATQ
jgi:hypothetical protein